MSNFKESMLRFVVILALTSIDIAAPISVRIAASAEVEATVPAENVPKLLMIRSKGKFGL